MRIEGEGGEVNVFNFVVPTFYHYIQVSVRDGEGGKGRKKRVEKVYTPKDANMDWKGEEWWTTCVFPLTTVVPRSLLIRFHEIDIAFNLRPLWTN